MDEKLETAAAEIADSVSQYLHSVAEHLCVISQMSGTGLSDLLIDLALLARIAEQKKENSDATASEKAI